MELDGRVKLNTNLGFLSTVDDARKKLEDIFKVDIDKSKES